jgi:hypothetical protein
MMMTSDKAKKTEQIPTKQQQEPKRQTPIRTGKDALGGAEPCDGTQRFYNYILTGAEVTGNRRGHTIPHPNTQWRPLILLLPVKYLAGSSVVSPPVSHLGFALPEPGALRSRVLCVSRHKPRSRTQGAIALAERTENVVFLLL